MIGYSGTLTLIIMGLVGTGLLLVTRVGFIRVII